MSKITNRLAFFAKIQRRSAELTKTAEEWAEIWRKEGRADASGSIPPENIDRQNFPEKREPYVANRYATDINYAVSQFPDKSAAIVNNDVTERAKKVAQGHFSGASTYLINEVMVENADVKGLTLMVTGWTGKGTITKTVGGVVNDGPYAYGTSVVVTFTPAAGYHFVKWSDDVDTPSRTVTVTTNRVLEVVAEQVPVYTLAFSASGTGTLTATAAGTAVQSGAQLEAGVDVVLTATPGEGYMFDSWSGLPEGAVTTPTTASFSMPAAAVNAGVNFVEAPLFQGLKLTNTAVSEYITGLTEAPTAQLQFSEMFDEPGLPYPYYWCDDDYDAYTATRNPGIGDTISGSSETEVSAGVVTAYISTPISNVLHFQPGTDTGFQSLQYSTDALTWTDWPVTPGAPTVESTFLAVCASSSTLGYIEDGGLTCEYVYAGPVHGNSIHYRYKWSKRSGSGPDYVYTEVRDPQGHTAYDGTGSSAGSVFEVSGGGIIDHATVDSFTTEEGGTRYYFDGAVSGVMSGAYGVYKWTSDDGNSLFTDVRNPLSGRDIATDGERGYTPMELEPFNSYNAIASFVSYNSETNKSKWSTYSSDSEAIELEFTGRNPAIDSETSEGVAFHVVKVYYDKGFTANTDLGVMTFNNPHPVIANDVCVVAWSSTTDSNQAVMEAAFNYGINDPTVGDAIIIFETVEGGPTGSGEITSVSKPDIKITLQGIDEEFVINGRNITVSWSSTTTEHEVYTNTYWPVAGELCQYWTGEHPENEVATIATVTISNPDTYGTVTFSNDLYLKGVSDSWSSDSSMSKLWTDGTVNASGRVSSVISGTDQPADFSEVSFALAYIFGDYDEVGQFVRVVDASGLVLDDTLGNASYCGMFNMNTTLTTPPALPATTLIESCYAWMFTCCESLTTAPVLPALTLAESCYQGMFGECPLINDITCLATDISAQNCTDNWLNGVAASGTFHRNPDTWAGWTTGVSGIPSGWEVDPPAPADTRLRFTVLNPGQTARFNVVVGGSFTYNSNNLSYSTDGATWTTVDASHYSVDFTDTLYLKGTNDVFITDFNNSKMYELICQGTPVSLSGRLLDLLDGGTGTVTELTAGCIFQKLFSDNGGGGGNVSTITDASGLVLPSNVTERCYQQMFIQAPIVTPPALPATTLAARCYVSMFQGCTSLTTAPNLPATTLSEYCYASMFNGCSSLNEIHCAATDISASSCTSSWLNGVAASGDFYGKSAAGWTTSSASGIPSGWTAHLD